jgi:hypothetical protein
MKHEKIDKAFQLSERWRNATIGFLLALIAGLALLGAGIANPARQVVSFACIALSLCFVVSFVMTAFTSFRFRRSVSTRQLGHPSRPKAAMSRHDQIVYLFAFGSGAVVGLGYFLSWRSVPWAWPAFVTVYLILTGAFLWWRRAHN